MKHAIWNTTKAYLLSKRYVVWAFRQYNPITIIGKANLPAEGPVILAPNHRNALMDALALLCLPPFNLPKIFLARADIFKLPATVVRFLRFAKILPAFRIRDGYDQLERNKATFNEAELSLINKAAVGIMPEGNQGDERNIRPIVKGIFRIAFSTQLQLPEGQTVKIIPIGLEYSNLIRPLCPLVVQVGEPIDVADYMMYYKENPAKATNALRMHLKESLEHLTVHIPTGSTYTMHEELMELICGVVAKCSSAEALFSCRQQVARWLDSLEAETPSLASELNELYHQYSVLRKELNLPRRKTGLAFEPTSTPWQLRVKSILFIIIALPGLVINLLPYLFIRSVPRMAGIKYKGFFSTVYFVTGLVVLPLYYIVLSLTIISLTPQPWWLAVLAIPLYYHSGKLSIRCIQQIEQLHADTKMLKIIKHKPATYSSLQSIRQKIIKISTQKTILTNSEHY
jgi:1-acyl-sn-glycerol-3-phosphate acyltransferase